MNKGWYWRLLLVLACIILAGIYVVPTISGTVPEDPDKPEGKRMSTLPDWWPKRDKRVSLGLDLQGGMYLILSVDTEKAVLYSAERMTQSLRKRLEEEDIGVTSVHMIEDTQNIALQVEKPGDLGAAKDEILDYFGNVLKPVTGVLSAEQTADTFAVSFRSDHMDNIKERAVSQAVKTLRNRVDEFNVREPEIVKQGENSILIQLPGLKDPERALKLIGRTAQLEFRVCDDYSDIISGLKGSLPEGIRMERIRSHKNAKGKMVVDRYLVAQKKEQLQEFLNDRIPRSHEVAYGSLPDLKSPGKEEWRTYLLHGRSETTWMTGDTLTDANVQLDQQKNEPYVLLNFDAKGAGEFEEVTGNNVKERMAIVLEGVVDSAPVIQSRISGGRGQITLNAMKGYNELLKDAQDLAIVLRSGALPAPVRIEQNRTVGPSLGADSIGKGKMSLIVGTILVVIFMLLYYKGTGVVNVFALSLNVLFIFAILAGFEATLTLPGLAGIVLTIGMAVDANVIINERVREELRVGKTPRAAVEGGYGKALWTILDANITTIIAGVVLLQYGSGPIRGFAVTLIVGVLCSVFTAMVCTRLVMDFITNKFRVQRLSI